jgi:hypothetical protein
MTTTTYRIENIESGADLGLWTAASPAAALRAMATDAGAAELLVALDAGDLWTCATGDGMRGEIAGLSVRPVTTRVETVEGGQVLHHDGTTVRWASPVLDGLELDAAEYACEEIYGPAARCDDEHAADRSAIVEAFRAARA